MKSDRVKIYKFDADGNGQVIAEAINSDRFNGSNVLGRNFRIRYGYWYRTR